MLAQNTTTPPPKRKNPGEPGFLSLRPIKRTALFRSVFQSCGFASFCAFRCSFTLFAACRAAGAAGTGAGAAGAAGGALRRSRTNLCFFFDSNLFRRAFNNRLRCGTCIVNRDGDWHSHGCVDKHGSILVLRFAGLTLLPGWAVATVAAFVPILTLWAILTFPWLAFLTLLSFRLVLTLLAFLTLRALLLGIILLRNGRGVYKAVIVVIAVDIIAVTVILEFAALIALETFLHLSLSRCDDTVVVFRVLQIVFSHDTVAGALRITGQRRVFFRYVLGRAADFNIGAGTVIGSGQRVTALAVEIIIISTTTIVIVVIIVATTPSAALVLLSWPHQLLT